LDLNCGVGNLSTAIRLACDTEPSDLSLFARHATDALWTVVQQLLFDAELPSIFIGDPLGLNQSAKPLDLQADCILVAPPFGLNIRDAQVSKKLGRVLSSEEAYLRQALEFLSPKGRVVALLPNGGLSNPARTSLREDVLLRNGLTAVFEVGAFLPGSGAAASIVVLDRARLSSGQLFFANAQNRQQQDDFDCRGLPGLSHVLDRFDSWIRSNPNETAIPDETGLTATAAPIAGALNAGPHLVRQARSRLPLASFDHLPLESIAQITKGAAIRRSKQGGDVPFIAPGAIRPLEISLDPLDRADELEVRRYPNAVAQEGDVVLNGVSTYVAAAALIEDGQYPINRHVFRIRVDKSRVIPGFLVIAINSRYVRDSLKEDATGSIMKMLTVPKLKKTLIPIPPLSVQVEIVQRVHVAKQERDAAARALQAKDIALSALVQDLGTGDAA
jgi:hypothetical protein